MKVIGSVTLAARPEKVWDALLDPQVLARTIPGCERLESTGEHTYDLTVTAGVASITGTYSGTCSLSDLQPNRSLVLSANGSGAPGSVAADVRVELDDNGDGTTGVSYDADAVVGGMIGGVGQRMLTSVGKRMAAQFFAALDDELTGAAPHEAVVAEVAAPAATDASRTGPVRPVGGNEFVKGALLGGGLVLLGVVAGALGSRFARGGRR